MHDDGRAGTKSHRRSLTCAFFVLPIFVFVFVLFCLIMYTLPYYVYPPRRRRRLFPSTTSITDGRRYLHDHLLFGRVPKEGFCFLPTFRLRHRRSPTFPDVVTVRQP